MASKIDTSNWDALAQRLKNADKTTDKMIREIFTAVNKEALDKIKRQTPEDTAAMVNSWKITPPSKSGDVYKSEVQNNVGYAPYVEFGHRTRDHKKWVKGFFPVTRTFDMLESEINGIVEPIVRKYLKDLF